MTILDFEKPIGELLEQIDKMKVVAEKCVEQDCASGNIRYRLPLDRMNGKQQTYPEGRARVLPQTSDQKEYTKTINNM